jgi:hypothetical protein
MSDPYGGQYSTAGNPWVAANGATFNANASPNDQSYYPATFGADAAKVWAEDINRSLLSSGQALQTAQGVVSMDAVKAQLQSNGYVGPTDVQSIASAFGMLHTAKPASLPAPGSTPTGPLGSSLGSIPTPVWVGGGLLLLLVVGGRVRL